MKEFFVDIVWGKILKPVWELWKAIANFYSGKYFQSAIVRILFHNLHSICDSLQSL